MLVGDQYRCADVLRETVGADEPCQDFSFPDPARPAADPAMKDCYSGFLICGVDVYRPDLDQCERFEVVSASAIAGYVCPAEVTADDARIELDRCQFSTIREDRRPAPGTTGYRCPDGSRGQATGPDSICVADQDGVVQAVAVTTFSCPSGSTGSPTAAAPTCTSTTSETVPAIVETETAFKCPEDTVGEPTSEDPTCARTTGAVTVPASVVTEFSCPAGTTGVPTFTDPFCETG